jgi:spermidine/putrescine transport system ATP-binding protein
MAVTCVCTEDAVRVLARSAAAVIKDPAVDLVASPV